MKEKWIGIYEYPRYEVSNLGDVRVKKTGQVLRPYTTKWGYKVVSLSKNSVKKGIKISRLVCYAFHENPSNKPCVNHIDGVKANNCAPNLEWCTYKENIAHAHLTGLKPRITAPKLTTHQVKRIRLIKEITPKISSFKVAPLFNISASVIRHIWNRRTWEHV